VLLTPVCGSSFTLSLRDWLDYTASKRAGQRQQLHDSTGCYKFTSPRASLLNIGYKRMKYVFTHRNVLALPLKDSQQQQSKLPYREANQVPDAMPG
jgi:hypothetical protein